MFLHYYSGGTQNKPEKVGTFECCGRRTQIVYSSSDQIKNLRESTEECSTMDASATINGSVTDAGVTIFANEACDAVDVLGNYMPMTLAIPQPDLQDIKAYFERPRTVARGAVNFGSVNPLVSIGFSPSNADLKTFFPQWTQRLAGAYGIRFSLNFRLQVAATSFHQGVLAMGWQYGLPAGFGAFNRTDKSYTITNLPHVRLDLSEQTMVELKVPFMHPTEFLEVEPVDPATNPLAAFLGTLGVVPILPSISVAGLNQATYTLYMFMTDIELFGVDVINPSTVNLQSGGGLITKEVKDSKVVSGTLSNMAKISRFVSRGVPSLAAIAGPAAWALDTASGVAKYFGYSKPMVQDPPVKMYRTNYGNEYQVDVPQTGDVVGVFQENTTTIDTSLGGTDVDEMALSFVAQQWSQVNRIVVSFSNTHGTQIYSAPVSPSVFWYRSGSTQPFSNIVYPFNSTSLISNSGNSFMPSSLMYISSFFRYWRGSIKFRFTFSKTKLHGGRYMVTYNPALKFQSEAGNFGGNVTGPEVVSSYYQPYGNSMIMDLKDGNVFEFTCPFVSTTPYKSFNSSTGGITIVCMDPLQSTATVTSVVPLLIEVCGGEDFELADYAGVYFPLHTSGTIYTQSGGNVSITTKPPSSNTMGERIMSVKQMIQVPSPYVNSVAAGTSGKYYVCPWFTNPTWQKANALAALPNGNLATNSFSGGNNAGMALAKCYAFAKGGTNLHIYCDQPTTVIRVFQANSLVANANQQTTTLARGVFPSTVPTVIQTGGLAAHLRLPSYQSIVRIPSYHLDSVFNDVFDASNAGVNGSLGHLYCVNIGNPGTVTANNTIFRSASDDAQLAHYMGPVPVFIPSSTTVNAFDALNTVYN